MIDNGQTKVSIDSFLKYYQRITRHKETTVHNQPKVAVLNSLDDYLPTQKLKISIS